MKKRSILLTILSVMMVVSLAIPAFTAFAEESTEVPQTITVEVFNGNADNVTLKNATATQDGGDTVISVSNAWSGYIMFNEKTDLSAAKDGQLCFEYKGSASADGKTWTNVQVVSFVEWWDKGYSLNNGGTNMTFSDDYVTVKYPLSVAYKSDKGADLEATAVLAQFKGLALGTGANFTIKRVWVEYPNPDYSKEDKPTEEGTYDLITAAVASQQDTNTWQHIATIPSDYAVKKGDKIKITLNFNADVPETGKTLDMWVGDNKITFNGESKENYIYSKNAEWEYTFNGSYSGDIKFGMWDGSFSIETATLTIVKHEQEETATGYDIFTGITEVGEPAQNAQKTAWTADYKGTVNGKAVSDGTALAFGTLEDGTYYISGTNANTATRATIAVTDITPALLSGGVLKFKAKFDFAGEEGRYAKLRLYYECGQWGEASFVETALTDYVAGEWKEYSIELKTLNIECAKSTTFGNPAPAVWFDWAKFVGMGISMGSTGEGDNIASFADVKIADVAAKTIVGIEAEGARTEYMAGEAFETAGLTVNVVLDDNSKVEVKNYTYSPEILTVGTKKVVISWSYNGKTYTAEIAVTVTSEYSSLAIKTQPTKTAYKSGEKFETDGMVVVAVKADGTEVEVNEYEYYKGMLTPGMTSLEVSFNGMKANVTITVAQFENSLSLMNKTFAQDGEPRYGWNAQVANNALTSQAKYDAASEEDKAKLIVTPNDTEKGYYISANFDANNYATRIFEYQVADYKFGNIYEDEDYNAMVSITYRTTSTFDKAVNFGLANFKEWNLGYHNADISSYIVSDGEWHTMYFDIALVYGEIDGMLWAGMSGEVDFNKIVGFAVQSQAVGTLDIVDVSVNWNGSADAAKAVDTTAPEFKYQGEMTINAKAGDPVPTFEGASAYDKNDGVVDVIVEWSDGAVTDGKLNEGTHTAKLYAKDAAGNACEAYNITVKVEKNGSPVDSSSGSADSGSASDSSSEKGCASAVATLPAMLSLLGFAVVYTFAKKKQA